MRTERDPLGELQRSRRRATTASQTRARSRTSRSAACARPPTSSPRPSSSRKPRPKANATLGRLDARRRRRDHRRAPTRSCGAACAISSSSTSIQAGAGTSHNMNANEVLANRAAELLGEPRGAYTRVHPERSRQHGAVDQRRLPDGDAAGAAARRRAARRRGATPLAAASRARPTSSRDVLKTGRTHLQDAVPITLGQEFSGYAACVNARGADDVRDGAEQLLELNIGATAVGTGLNAGDDYRQLVVGDAGARSRASRSRRRTNLFRVTQSMGDVARVYSSAMRRLAVELGRSRATCACSAWARAPALARSRCRPCSRARRSCRAR